MNLSLIELYLEGKHAAAKGCDLRKPAESSGDICRSAHRFRDTVWVDASITSHMSEWANAPCHGSDMRKHSV